MVRYLTADDVLRIHWALVGIFEQEADPISPAGPRDRGLLESATGRPMTALGKTEKYTGIDHKAAALFHSLVMNHPFHNGNKRTALVSLLVFLDQNERLVDVTDDELFNFVVAVADNRFPVHDTPQNVDGVVEAIREWVDDHVVTRGKAVGEMKTRDFLTCVEAAGGTFREAGKGGSWVVSGTNGKSIRISQSTPKLEDRVVRTYLTKLGLSPGQSGVYMDEFRDGVDSEQALIRRFRSVLKRLAHA